jgi:hypothetical protein
MLSCLCEVGDANSRPVCILILWPEVTTTYFTLPIRGRSRLLHSAKRDHSYYTLPIWGRSRLPHSANRDHSYYTLPIWGRSRLPHSANRDHSCYTLPIWGRGSFTLLIRGHGNFTLPKRGRGYFILTNRWSCLVSLLFQTEITFFFVSANRRLSHVDNLKISLYAIPVPISAPAILALSAPGLSRCQLSQSENAPVPAQPVIWSVCTDRIFQLEKYSALYFMIH